jgi:hypothetical protein
MAFGATGSRQVRLGVLVVGATASCAIYELFMRSLIAGMGSRPLWLMLTGLVLFAGGCGGWAGHSDAARVAVGLAVMTVLVSLASWGLYGFTTTGSISGG